jgi:hypothetical protein
MIKRNRHVATRYRCKQPAPEFMLHEKQKLPKPHDDWYSSGIPISDHAVVRFFEICIGIDMAAIRAQMIRGKESIIKKNRDCKLPIDMGHIVVRNGVVVTVLRTFDKKGKSR